LPAGAIGKASSRAMLVRRTLTLGSP
jgi:hypothetical protein